jgi:3-phenylpropionate/trans-cinnamate dioxygenase ferredoxin reductase component
VTTTGFAPIKSIVEDALRRGERRPLRLYWGARQPGDLYMLDRVGKWAARSPSFAFNAVLSEASADWQGRTGLVHRAVLQDHPDLTVAEVYACGNPLMIAAAREDFVREAGLPRERFYADAFADEPAAWAAPNTLTAV